MKLRNVKGGRLEELKNLKLVLAAAIDGYSDPKALPQLAVPGNGTGDRGDRGSGEQ